jgi:hypothetical protein
MIDDSDGGAASEPIPSWQPSTKIESDGEGDTVDVETHAVAVSTRLLIANHAWHANRRGTTAIDTRIRK